MVENEAFRWAVSAVLLAAALAAVCAAVGPSPSSAPAFRIDRGLHALMLTAMALMLHPAWSGPVLPQVLFFVLAAWWFVLRALSRRPASGPASAAADLRRTADSGRGAMMYHALTMAAMAYMLLAGATSGAHPASAAAEAGGDAVVAPHHGPGAPVAGLLPEQAAGADLVPLLLAVVFGLAAILWGVRLIRQLRSGAPRSGGSAFPELAGAAVMAVMFASLAASRITA